MVYCTKCGTKNEDEAKVCSKCGAPLQVSRPVRRYRSGGDCFGPGGRPESECFGLPHGGAIAGLIFGAIVLIIGLALLSGIQVWDYLWALIVVVFGLLIIAGALYGMRRT